MKLPQKAGRVYQPKLPESILQTFIQCRHRVQSLVAVVGGTFLACCAIVVRGEIGGLDKTPPNPNSRRFCLNFASLTSAFYCTLFTLHCSHLFS